MSCTPARPTSVTEIKRRRAQQRLRKGLLVGGKLDAGELTRIPSFGFVTSLRVSRIQRCFAQQLPRKNVRDSGAMFGAISDSRAGDAISSRSACESARMTSCEAARNAGSTA